jgi:hypothetical protein
MPLNISIPAIFFNLSLIVLLVSQFLILLRARNLLLRVSIFDTLRPGNKIKEVVFEELVAFHEASGDCFVGPLGLLAMTDLWIPAFAGITIGEKGSGPINAQ